MSEHRTCFLLIVLICYPVIASQNWRDPHELKLEMPHATKIPNTDLDLSCQRQDEEQIKILIYYKRSLKILTKHLAPKQDDETKYDFNLYIAADYYNDLIKAIDDVSYDFKHLKRLDDALSHVEGKGAKDRFKEAVLSWSEYIRMNWFTKETAVLSFTLMLPIIVYCYKNASRQTIVLLVVFAIWAADFAVTWFNKYEDLEVDHMVDMSRYASSEPNCDLTKLWFYERWFSSLSPTEECRRFYTAKYKNRNYQIGPYDVVIEQAGKMMKIFRFVATESSNFLSLLTANIPWPLSWIVIIAVVILGFYITMLILFLIFGYSFRFNIAHLINFDIRNDQNPRVNREFRELIQEVRQIPIRMVDTVRDIMQINAQTNQINQQSTINNNPSRDIDNSNLLTVTNPPSVNLTASTSTITVDSETQTTDVTADVAAVQQSVQIVHEVAPQQTHNLLLEHRPDIIQENTDKDDSSSESIEVVGDGDSNRNADFEEYVIVNEGSGDRRRYLEID